MTNPFYSMHADPDAHIQSFLDYLRFEKRFSAHTILAYRNDLEQFYAYLRDDQAGAGLDAVSPGNISSLLIRSWLALLKDQKASAKTINRKISTLKSYFKYYMRTGVLEKTPMTNITAPKIPKRLPQYVEQKDTETLFHHVEFPDNWTGKTDRLLLAVFYQTGMRLSELMNLRESQLNFSKQSRSYAVKVIGKGNKERVIPVGEELAEMIWQYIEQKKATFENPERSVLFVNEKGKKLYPKYVYRVVKKYLSNVTTIDKRSPHVLRHTFATHLTNGGADLYAVKELLGHASLAATQIYTHITIQKLKDTHRQAHPKA